MSVLHFRENNEYRLLNSRVNSIVLNCLETLVEHEPRVNEIITSQSIIVLRFEFKIRNCGNNMLFIVLTVSSAQNLVLYRGFQTHARDKILLFD